jgi:hypothetical protein
MELPIRNFQRANRDEPCIHAKNIRNDFTMVNQGNIVRCAVSTAAMDDLEGKHDVKADQRVDQFVRLRDAIEERASRKFFGAVRMPSVNRGGRLGDSHSPEKRLWQLSLRSTSRMRRLSRSFLCASASSRPPGRMLEAGARYIERWGGDHELNFPMAAG